MKTMMKRGLGGLLALVMLLSLMAVYVPMSSAEAVVHRPVQRQYEEKWKSYYIGGRSMYQTACGIFSIVNAVGYLTGNEMDVMEVGRWANSIGAFNTASFGGSDRAKLYSRLQGKYGEKYGFTVDCNGGGGYWAGASSSKLKNHLENGGVAIGHVKGHFITIVDYDRSANKFRIFDSAPSSARGTLVYGEYGKGDVWVTQSFFSTTAKLTLDWFCLLTGTGYPINLDYGEPADGSTKAEPVGTYRVNSKAPASDPLNIRAGAGSSYDILGTMTEGALVYGTEVSGNWLKMKQISTGIEGWVSTSYVDYIGVDVLGGTGRVEWGNMTTSVDENGQFTIVNNSSTESAAYDWYLPIAIGTRTTPFMSLQITPNYGNGYYFGVTEAGSGYWMMRDCNSSDQLVVAESAPYMTGQETLEIDMRDWWKPTDNKMINVVRFYVAPASSVTFNYFYFATASKKVTDTTYNLIRGNSTVNPSEPLVNETLMAPDTLSVADRTLSGEYLYEYGTLNVTANSASGYTVSFNPNKTFKPQELDRLLYSVNSNVRFDIELIVTTSEGDRSVSLVSDFWPAICESLDGNYIPAMDGSRGLDLLSVYTWNNVLPADGVCVVKTVNVKLGGAGTLMLGGLQLANQDIMQIHSDDVVKEDKTPEANQKGDVNFDKTISTQDARVTMLFALMDNGMNADQIACADMNGDGEVTTADARLMMLAALMD